RALRARAAPVARREARRRHPPLPAGPPPAARQLDVQTAGLVVRPPAAGPVAGVRGRLAVRGPQGRGGELLSAPGHAMTTRLGLAPPIAVTGLRRAGELCARAE